jgi:peptide/nickel transport system substrate-binding protein
MSATSRTRTWPRSPEARPCRPTDPLGSAYNLAANYTFGIEYFLINFNNPTLGPAFKQLYVRQAIQESIDQEGMVKAIQRGYGYPTSGGVPSKPSSQWVPSVQSQNGGQGPYPFSTSAATALLTSHGWKEVGGVMTCETAAKCGPGVTQGTKLSITMDYATGVAYFQSEVAVMKSDFAQAGVQLNLVPQSFNTIIGEAAPCKPTAASCKWQALNFGGWNFNGPGYEPTGEPLFQTGAESNSGSYSDPQEDKLINLTHTSNSLSVFDAVRDLHGRAAAVHLDAGLLHGPGGQQQAGERRVQPAVHATARVLELHQVTSG